MQQAMLNFCEWLQNTPVVLTIGHTLWGYPYVQLIHFFGLSIWVGTIMMLDLRLLGLAGRSQSVGQLAKQLSPWTWTALAIVVTGGSLLFSVAAASYFQNPAFRFKIPLVLTGIAYHIVIVRNVPKWDRSPSTPPLAKLAGLLEILLWLAVITAAVEIPTY